MCEHIALLLAATTVMSGRLSHRVEMQHNKAMHKAIRIVAIIEGAVYSWLKCLPSCSYAETLVFGCMGGKIEKFILRLLIK